MKILLTSLLICLFYGVFAQDLPIDSTTKLITYSSVINVPGNQDELYSRAREWFAKTYNSAKSVIQMDSKDKIVGKALTHMNKYYGYINYTISIYLKDGKYKYEITNFYHTGEYAGSGITIPDYGVCEEMINSKKKRNIYYLSQLNNDTKELITELTAAMSKQVVKNDSF